VKEKIGKWSKTVTDIKVAVSYYYNSDVLRMDGVPLSGSPRELFVILELGHPEFTTRQASNREAHINDQIRAQGSRTSSRDQETAPVICQTTSALRWISGTAGSQAFAPSFHLSSFIFHHPPANTINGDRGEHG